MDQRIRKWFVTRDEENNIHIEEQMLYNMMPINRVPKRPDKYYPVEVKVLNGVKYMCTFDDENQSFVLITKIHPVEPGFTSLDETDEDNAYEIAKHYIK